MVAYSRLAVSFMVISSQGVSCFPPTRSSSFLQKTVFLDLLEWIKNLDRSRRANMGLSLAESKRLLKRNLSNHQFGNRDKSHLHLIQLSTDLIVSFSNEELTEVGLQKLVQHGIILREAASIASQNYELVDFIDSRATLHEYIDEGGLFQGMIELINCIHNGWYELKAIESSNNVVLSSKNQLTSKQSSQTPVVLILDISTLSLPNNDNQNIEKVRQALNRLNFEAETREGQRHSSSIDPSEAVILKGSLGLAHSSHVCSLLTKPAETASESAKFNAFKQRGLLFQSIGCKLEVLGNRYMSNHHQLNQKKNLLFDILQQFGWEGIGEPEENLNFYYYLHDRNNQTNSNRAERFATAVVSLNRCFPFLPAVKPQTSKELNFPAPNRPSLPQATILGEVVDLRSDDAEWWGANTNMCYLLIHRQLMTNMFQGFANLCKKYKPSVNLSPLSSVFKLFREADADFKSNYGGNPPGHGLNLQDYCARLLVYSLQKFIDQMLGLQSYVRLMATTKEYTEKYQNPSLNNHGKEVWTELMNTRDNPPERCNQNFELLIADVISLRFLANLPLEMPGTFSVFLRAVEATFKELQVRQNNSDVPIRIRVNRNEAANKVRVPLFSFYFKPPSGFFAGPGHSVLNKDEENIQLHEDYIRDVARRIDMMSMSELQGVEREIDFRDRYTRFIFQQFMIAKRENPQTSFTVFISSVEKIRLD